MILSTISLDRVEEVLNATGNLPVQTSRLALALATAKPEIKDTLQPLLRKDLYENSRFIKAFSRL